MRISTAALSILALTAMGHTALSAQEARSSSKSSSDVAVRDERFRWSFGIEGGALFFTTQKQTLTGIPAAGAHINIVSRRGGLQLGVDQGFGSDEPSAFIDPESGNVQRQVSFDRLRRYSANLTAYPIRGSLAPYIGAGVGLLQVLNPQVQGAFTSPENAALSEQAARDRSATGFVSLIAGVQFRVGRMSAFGQYAINTGPGEDNLIRGTGHSLMGGLRFSLGSARENIKGGGY